MSEEDNQEEQNNSASNLAFTIASRNRISHFDRRANFNKTLTVSSNAFTMRQALRAATK